MSGTDFIWNAIIFVNILEAGFMFTSGTIILRHYIRLQYKFLLYFAWAGGLHEIKIGGVQDRAAKQETSHHVRPDKEDCFTLSVNMIEIL